MEINFTFLEEKRSSSVILCMALFVAVTLFTTGCSGSTDQNGKNAFEQNTGANVQADAIVLGEGDTVFDFTVVDKEGTESRFEIHTDETTVGDALTKVGLIEGEESEYGLYVKTVNGITADYDKDGVYWAFCLVCWAP